MGGARGEASGSQPVRRASPRRRRRAIRQRPTLPPRAAPVRERTSPQTRRASRTSSRRTAAEDRGESAPRVGLLRRRRVTAVRPGVRRGVGPVHRRRRQDRRLLVVGERSGRLASLAGVDAGFGEVTAFEIDRARATSGSSARRRLASSSTLHKLQLISGRVLFSIRCRRTKARPLHRRRGDAAEHPRARRRRPSGLPRRQEGQDARVAARLAAPDVAQPGASVRRRRAYAAYDRGLVRIDLATGTIDRRRARASERRSAGLTWIRWHRGVARRDSEAADGSTGCVRIRLDDAAGRPAPRVPRRAAVLAGPTSATIAGNVLHYLGQSPSGDELEVKKLSAEVARPALPGIKTVIRFQLRKRR